MTTALLFSRALPTLIQPMHEVKNTTVRFIPRAPHRQNYTPVLNQHHWFSVSERIKCKAACPPLITAPRACKRLRGIALYKSYYYYLSKQLHFTLQPFPLSRSLSDTCVPELQRNSWLFSHFGPHSRRHQALCYSLLLQKHTQDVSLLQIFQLTSTGIHPGLSLQCVCVCVWGGGCISLGVGNRCVGRGGGADRGVIISIKLQSAISLSRLFVLLVCLFRRVAGFSFLLIMYFSSNSNLEPQLLERRNYTPNLLC